MGRRTTSDGLLAVAGLRPPGPVDAAVVAALRRHRLAPLACVVLDRVGDPGAELVRSDLSAAVSTHLRALATLADLGAALAGVPWAVLKGPVLSELAHPVPGVRAYSDVDVLVRPVDLRSVVAVLTGRGWQLLDRSHRLLLERLPGELHLLGPHGVAVDLHWSLVNDARTRREVDLPVGPLLSRRVVRVVGAAPVPVLDDVDALLHLCLHAALGGADRLLWLLDLDGWVRLTTPDWEVVVRRAREQGVTVPVALCLARASRVLGTPVPGGVAVELVPPRSWRGLTSAVDRVWPVPRVRSDRSVARMVARASRGSGRASLAELARRAPRAVVAREAVRDSVGEDRPDQAAWRGYLDAVEAS